MNASHYRAVELAMDIDSMIEVLQAAKAREQIQARSRVGGSKWRDSDDPAWDFLRFDYRTKPEPREWMASVSAKSWNN